ncbi:MAG: glycine oxidase [Rhodobacteraceae bacterium HLUCCO07]|nr:MAG: glycine oxidase [Rhodobacteraceae bacterium HLUCCO07]
MIIIGAGIAGLSLGWQLARRGLAPTVIDAGTIGQGASHAAAGYLQPGLDPSLLTDLEWESLRATPAFIADLEAETGLPVDFRTDGQLRIGFAGDEAEIRADHDTRRAAGWDVTLMDGADARALEPALSPEVTIACLLNDVSWVDGRRLCTALASAITARGGQVIEHCPALALTHERGRVTGVKTPKGHMPSDRVALAAGHRFDRIKGLPADLPASIPVRGVILALACPTPLFTRLVKRPDGILCPFSKRPTPSAPSCPTTRCFSARIRGSRGSISRSATPLTATCARPPSRSDWPPRSSAETKKAEVSPRPRSCSCNARLSRAPPRPNCWDRA